MPRTVPIGVIRQLGSGNLEHADSKEEVDTAVTGAGTIRDRRVEVRDVIDHSS